MTMEVSTLLSQAVLDTSGLTSGSSTPKHQGPCPWPHHYLLSQIILPRPVDTSSQVNISDDADMDDPTLEEIHASPTPPFETLGPDSETSSLNVTQLHEEAIKAWDTNWQPDLQSMLIGRKQISDFGMALCQN